MVEREINWEWTDSAVEMIPFGLLTGFYGKKEIRITKLAEEGFCFRSAEKFCGLEKSFRFCFYDLRQSRYREILLPGGQSRKQNFSPAMRWQYSRKTTGKRCVRCFASMTVISV